jgi:hypothetical protein
MLINKYLTTTSVNDVNYIAPRLRKADKDECLAATGKEPLGILYQSLLLGDITLTMRTPEGERVGLCGVAPSPLNNAGVVWMCATDAILNHQMAFLRRSKDALTYLSDGYSVLHNCVDARNEVHIKWLKWMGFTFLNRHEKYGAEQRPFYEFMRITNV